MSINLRGLLHAIGERRQLRLFWVVVGLIAVLLLSRLVEVLVLGYDDRNYPDVLESTCSQYLSTAESEFNGAQRNVRRVATEVAQLPEVLNFLSGRDTNRVALFDQVVKAAADQDMGVEVYDRRAEIVAWEGRSGPTHKREVRISLDGQMISYVNRTPIASQLFVTIPVRDNGAIIGSVLVRRTIDVNYPLNNRFIRREGLSEQLNRKLGASFEFNFSPNAEPKKDGRYQSAILYGIDSSAVGVVSVLKPARSAYLESVSASFEGVQAVVIALLIAALAWGTWRLFEHMEMPVLLRLGVVVGGIWLVRYAFLWIDVPSSLISTSIFDPAFFASNFGGGLAKSIGEMTLSAVAAAVSVLYVGNKLLAPVRDASARRFPGSMTLRILLVIVVSLLLFWILRGYGAIVRSAVFDSTLRYSDPKVIVPSFELGVMIIDLFLLGFCIVAIGAAATWFCLEVLSGGSGQWTRTTWFLAGGILGVSAVVFGLIQETPLMSTGYRLFYALIALGLAGYLARGARDMRPASGLRVTLIVLGLSAILYYPLIDENVREKDRDRVEAFAEELLKPVDGWFKFVVDDGLKGFTSYNTADILSSGDEEEISRLAFDRWAESVACREGYTSLFSVSDSTKHEVSRFAIGGQSSVTAEVESTMTLKPNESILVKDIGAGITALKVYAGSAPIIASDSALAGYARVIIVAGQQALFRGENPAILRSASSESPRSFYRPITTSEFRDGVLLTSTNPRMPLEQHLPKDVEAFFGSPSALALWSIMELDGTPYETFFARNSAGGDADIVSLEIRQPDIVWHLIGIVKILLYFSVLSALCFGCFLLFRLIRGQRYAFTFRDRLLIAFLITALVPLALIATYGRLMAKQRLMDNTSRRLGEETAAIVQNIPDSAGVNPVTLVSSPMAEQIASDIGADFNLYAGSSLRTTSRPELFEAGILDTRISGHAYANVVLRGSRFFVETERIGLYEYAVGYRPVQNGDGSIVGVVSVPTLYRQDEMDAEVSTRNAFLLGVYTVVLVAMLLIATTLAGRIAAPIHRLTEATRRVSQGDLNVKLQDLQAEGEIGELISSFETMAKDLQRSREELIRFEREMAWKEMAKQVAHEIKNPLTPMKLAVQHLRLTYRDRVADFDEVLDEVTRTIVEQIDTLSRIASEFSHFARMPKRQLELCEVNAVLGESAQLFDRQADVHFEMRLAEGLPSVLADKEELRRAFINILRNALQAMENRGTVRMTTANQGTGVGVTIADTGPGIPDDVRAKLFQPNFSTKTEGMGLGLAIVKKTIDDLGGTIGITSAPGEGTTVSIVLPAANGKAPGGEK